jgi:hypothetical protein
VFRRQGRFHLVGSFDPLPQHVDSTAAQRSLDEHRVIRRIVHDQCFDTSSHTRLEQIAYPVTAPDFDRDIFCDVVHTCRALLTEYRAVARAASSVWCRQTPPHPPSQRRTARLQTEFWRRGKIENDACRRVTAAGPAI